MKKILISIFLAITCTVQAHAIGNNTNYDGVYHNLPKLDVNFINSIDAGEYKDYQDFIVSPYPLIRTWDNLYCHNETVPAGYYLLTPRNINGKNVVLFKQEGKVKHIIPVFEKEKIDQAIVYKEAPKPKIKWYQKPYIWFKKGIAKLFGKYKKPPEAPKSKLNTTFLTNDYYRIDLYYNEYVYRMLFKTKLKLKSKPKT